MKIAGPAARRIAITGAIILTVLAADAALMRTLRYNRGLKGSFTAYHGMRRAQAYRLVKAVDFRFDDRPPITGFPSRNYLIRLSGKIIVPEDGDYTLALRTEGRAQLWIGETAVLDLEPRGRAEQVAATVALKKGRHRFRLHYAHERGAGVLQLFWKTPGSGAFRVIPRRHFIPELPIEPSLSSAK